VDGIGIRGNLVRIDRIGHDIRGNSWDIVPKCLIKVEECKENLEYF
jgi:hypothetical protein